MTLDQVESGQSFTVIDITDSETRAQAIRFGIAKGASAQCIVKLPAGPLVLKKGHQEIAIGRNIAKNIFVNIL